jgi:hypothetical protein
VPRQELITILTGYTAPGTPFVGVAPLGKNGLSVRVRNIVYFESAYRSLTYRQTYRTAMRHFSPMFHTWVGTIQEAWQSEIMRVMDKPRFAKRENLGVRLFHEKFQAEPSVTQAQKEDEGRLYGLLHDRYERDGYALFRNRLGFHIDLEAALQEPTVEGNLHDMTVLILDWYRYVGTIIYDGEPKYFTEGAQLAGQRMALQFKEMMLDTLYHRNGRQRVEGKKQLRRFG